MRRIATILVWTCLCAGSAFGQGSQRQSISVSPQGTPVPGANVWACQAGSSPSYTVTPPCTLANIYSNPSLSSTYLIAQPLISDGLGNYTYYAVAGTYVEVITGPNITGYSSTVVLSCAPNSTASGCASGGGNPAGSDTQVQINSHSQFGTITGLAVDSSTSPTVLNVPFSESAKGPRPRVDATAYGADPTGATDSTTALTNAAAAACAADSTLFLPPGTYSLSQPQSPSTSAVIPIPCADIHITALGDQGTAQSEQPPQAKLVVSNLGSSPNAMPVFAFKYPTNTGNITIENVQISGYNQTISFYTVTNVVLNNVCATAQSTGLTDNVPLKVTNASWFRMTGGCLNSGSSSLPMALFTGEAPLASEASAVTYLQMEHVRGSGANFQYLQRVNTSGSGPGNFVFNDVTPLNSTTDFLAVTNTTGHMGQTAMPQFGPVFFMNDSLPGATGSGALINFNSSGSNLVGVHVQNSSASSQVTPLIAVRMTAGSLQDCEVHGAVGALVEDGSGNTVGSCSLETRGGFDFLADSTIAPGARLRSESTTGATPTPNLRFYLSPNSHASYGIDAGAGFLFNDSTNNGFNGSLAETTSGAIDVQFANLFPPTNASGTATTGGTIPSGTYYPFVATTANSCATSSAPSIAGPAVTLSGSNDAIVVTWTAPLQGTGTINGFCVAIASSAANAIAGLSYAGFFASGATTTSATITTVSGGTQFVMANAMNSAFRFMPTALLPVATAGATVGSASLPFDDLFLGASTNKANDFNTGSLTANRTTTVPDANTVLPQPLTPAARQLVQGLSSSTGALSTITEGQCQDIQTATSYAIPATDYGCIVAGSNSSAQTYTIAQAGTGSFTNNFFFVLYNQGTLGQGNISLTASTSTITCAGVCSGSTIVLPPGAHAYIWSPDNANWAAFAVLPAQAADYAGKTSVISSTTLLASTPVTGLYRISAVLSCDSSSSAATVSLTVNWTDPSSTAQSVTSGAATCTTLGSSSYASLSQPMNVKGGTAITFLTAIANTPTYSLYAELAGVW